jgi:nickel-dependent lactate racemase
MKEIMMKYGKERVKFLLPEKNILGEINCTDSNEEGVREEEKVIMDALQNPIGSSTLREIVKQGERVCIIINDITRAYQRPHVFLPYIVKELNAGGVEDKDIIFLSATGAHRVHSDEEKKILMGEELSKRFTIIDHNCNEDDCLVYLGKTSNGTPVKINKIAIQSDHVVLTGGIITHDLVGWGGGRKSILPGIAGYESIKANHYLAFSETIGKGLRENIGSGIIEGNVQHQDIIEASEMIKPSFMFNVIMHRDGKIGGAVAGDYIKAHKEGCEIARRNLEVKLKEKADVAIISCGGYPKDVDLYIAGKSFENPTYAVKKGGYLIFLAECRDGVGYKEVEEVIKNFKTNLEREKFIRKNFTTARLGGYLTTKLIEDFNTIFVSELDEEIFENTDIRVVRDIQSALDIIYRELGHDFKAYLMRDPSNVLLCNRQ